MRRSTCRAQGSIQRLLLPCGMEAQPVRSGKEKAKKSKEISRSDSFDRLDLRHIMFDQAFNAAFQRDHGRRAARAGALHAEVELPVAIALVDDVAAVLRDCRADPRVEQFLDLVDDFGVGRIFLDADRFLRRYLYAGRAALFE